MDFFVGQIFCRVNADIGEVYTLTVNAHRKWTYRQIP